METEKRGGHPRQKEKPGQRRRGRRVQDVRGTAKGAVSFGFSERP